MSDTIVTNNEVIFSLDSKKYNMKAGNLFYKCWGKFIG